MERAVIISLLKDLFESQKLSVLATNRDGQPYTSLVAFSATGDLRVMMFVTDRSTNKYENMKRDDRVALLIDNRSNREDDFMSGVAVTALGRAEEVDPDSRNDPAKFHISKHPSLKNFVNSPTSAIFQVKIDRYYIVTNFQKVVEFKPGG